MVKMLRGTAVWAVGLAIIVLAPVSTSAQVINTDMGATERVWAFKSSPGTHPVAFVWIPTLSVFDAELFLIGECYREDSLGEPVGRHRVIFKNIVLVGVDSENSVEAVRSAQRIRNGFQKRLAAWALTDAARDLFADDSSILVVGEISVTRKVDAWDELTCGLGVTEILDVSTLSSAIETRPFEGALQVAFDADVPRLLKLPSDE